MENSTRFVENGTSSPEYNGYTPTQRDWARAEWFDQLFRSQNPSCYYCYEGNGYQRFRLERLHAYLAEYARTIGREAILDVGCGTGHFIHRVSREMGFARSTGIDIVESLIEQAAKDFPGIEFIQNALPSLPFSSDKFDLVVASEVLYYLTDSARLTALDEIHRVLKTGGHLLFSTMLGREAFSSASAVEFVRSRFEIVNYRFSHQKLFNFVIYPFGLAARFEHLMDTGDQSAKVKNVARVNRMRKWAGSRLFRLVIRTSSRASRPVLRSRVLPAAAEVLCGSLIPWFTRSNISIIGRKT